MKYWELIADKPSANGLVVRLLQRGYAAWPALEADPHKTDGRRYVGEFDELLSAFLELEATLPVILRVVIERFFLRSILQFASTNDHEFVKSRCCRTEIWIGRRDACLR
jgi:hypothetical protein